MSVNLNGNSYYRTAEVCRLAGVSKNTFLRWVRSGIIQDVAQRDRRGWRIFTEGDMQRVVSEANRTGIIRK
jgi:excisionase family DNA binding protein